MEIATAVSAGLATGWRRIVVAEVVPVFHEEVGEWR